MPPFLGLGGPYIGGSKNILSVLSGVTDGMTLDATWDTPGVARSDLSSQTAFSARIDLDIVGLQEGVIFEAGAVALGAILYVFNDVMYFQGQDGTTFGEAANRFECSWPIEAGTKIIEVSAQSGKGGALYVDGVLVDLSTVTVTVNLTGSNTGTVGGISSTVPVNRGGFITSGTSDGYAGTYSLLAFLGQVTSDIVEL